MPNGCLRRPRRKGHAPSLPTPIPTPSQSAPLQPLANFHVPFTRAMIGAFDVDLAHEFFQGFANHALVTLHVDNLRGQNAHHQAETVFKAFARALRMAITPDSRAAGMVPSTKGSL